jgi:hypothetical protein
MPLDKYGKCPNCDTDWNMGDIRNVLRKIETFSGKSDYELDKIAALYGWTEFNRSNFTALEVLTTEDNLKLGKCPNMRCGHYFNIDTGEEFSSLREVYNSKTEAE